MPSPVTQEACRLIADAGHDVVGWIPEDRLLRTDTVPDEADLYVLKSHTELALSYAGALHAEGTPVFNRYESCLLAQDKVSASRRMRRCGIPTPDTWLIDDPSQAAPLLAGGPLIVKPHRGHRGIGVQVVHTEAELAVLPPSSVPRIAQRFVPGPGQDLKVYVAGERVWAVRKTFDATSFTRPGVSVAVSDGVRAIALGVREAFGLELFGCDVIESPSGPQVVDVNYFPGYKGCPGPEPWIARAVLDFAAAA